MAVGRWDGGLNGVRDWSERGNDGPPARLNYRISRMSWLPSTYCRFCLDSFQARSLGRSCNPSTLRRLAKAYILQVSLWHEAWGSRDLNSSG